MEHHSQLNSLFILSKLNKMISAGWIITIIAVIVIIIAAIVLETTSSRTLPIVVIIIAVIVLFLGLLFGFASEGRKQGSDILKNNPELLELIGV